MNQVVPSIIDRLDRTSDEGATAVEYSLFVALIAAIIFGVVATLGGQVTGLFQTVVDLWPA